MLNYAREHGYTQGIIDIQTKLATIYLDERNDLQASLALEESDAMARKYSDRACIAQVKRLYARLYMMRSQYSKAEKAPAEAIDLFERLGMRRELAEAYQLRESLLEGTPVADVPSSAIHTM